MAFISLKNLDRAVDEFINTDHISRLRDLPSREHNKCMVSFMSGDSMTAGNSAEEIIALINGKPLP